MPAFARRLLRAAVSRALARAVRSAGGRSAVVLSDARFAGSADRCRGAVRRSMIAACRACGLAACCFAGRVRPRSNEAVAAWRRAFRCGTLAGAADAADARDALAASRAAGCGVPAVWLRRLPRPVLPASAERCYRLPLSPAESSCRSWEASGRRRPCRDQLQIVRRIAAVGGWSLAGWPTLAAAASSSFAAAGRRRCRTGPCRPCGSDCRADLQSCAVLLSVVLCCGVARDLQAVPRATAGASGTGARNCAPRRPAGF